MKFLLILLFIAGPACIVPEEKETAKKDQRKEVWSGVPYYEQSRFCYSYSRFSPEMIFWEE